MRAVIALTAAFALVATGLVTAAPPAEALEHPDDVALPTAQLATPVTTERIQGSDRFATSVEVSRSLEWTGDTVFLASGLGFADALAAAPVAASEDAHLLLTRPEAVTDPVLKRLLELAPDEIVLVGSKSTIHDSVRAQLAAALPTGTQITRIDGNDRVHTSLLLLDRLIGDDPASVDTVWVASGHNYPDALSAASVAGAHRQGIILQYHGGSEADRAAWVRRVMPYVHNRQLLVAGGTAWATGLESSARGSAEGFVGLDRYDTARLINAEYAPWNGYDTMVVATGQNFPDALSGAVLAAERGLPLYLSTTRCHAQVTGQLELEAARFGVSNVIGLGSSNSVSDAALGLQACPTYSTAQQSLGRSLGTFETRVYRGEGDAMIDLTRSTGVMLVSATSSDLDPFSVERLSAGSASNGMLIDHDTVWSDYTGSVMTDGAASDRYLRVEHDRQWAIRVSDIRHAPAFTGPMTVRGDTVLVYAGNAADWQLRTGDMATPVDISQAVPRGREAQVTTLYDWQTPFGWSLPIEAGPSLLRIQHGIPEGGVSLAPVEWTMSIR